MNFDCWSLQLDHSQRHLYVYLLPQRLLQLLFSPLIKCYIHTIINCSAISERYSFENNRKHCLPRIQFVYQVFQTYM